MSCLRSSVILKGDSSAATPTVGEDFIVVDATAAVVTVAV
jgi:hypothetical protein